MSDRPLESSTNRGPASDLSRTVESTRPQTQTLPSAGPSDGTGRPFELPPLPTAPAVRPDTFPGPLSRSASFSNLLNPAGQSNELPHGRRRKASELGSPPIGRPQLPPLTADGSVSTSVRSPSLSATTAAFSPNPIHGRRILTPRSPALHRATSLGQVGAPPASIDAQLQPFVASPRTRTYSVEPGRAGIPPLPATLSARPSYAHSPTVARTRPSRSVRDDERRRSGSLSPRSTHPAQASPAHGFHSSEQPLSAASAPTYSPKDDTEPYSGQLMQDHRHSGIPITPSAGQNAFQMMTLQTTSGTVQLPVEVQAASRVADEKRRRNAGASARFRARRKEKERESSVTIAKLEMQVKDLSDDVEFYRRERGYLAGIVLQMPGGERHFPRPTSPRHHRVPMSIQLGASRSTSVGYMSDPNMPPSPGEGRNVRRRTSTISLPMHDSSVHAMPGPSGYATRYDMPPMTGPPALTRPSLPGPAVLLAPTAPQHTQYHTAPPSEAGWTAYGSGPPTAPGESSTNARPRQT